MTVHIIFTCIQYVRVECSTICMYCVIVVISKCVIRSFIPLQDICIFESYHITRFHAYKSGNYTSEVIYNIARRIYSLIFLPTFTVKDISFALTIDFITEASLYPINYRPPIRMNRTTVSKCLFRALCCKFLRST